jgi:hypothetical protein
MGMLLFYTTVHGLFKIIHMADTKYTYAVHEQNHKYSLFLANNRNVLRQILLLIKGYFCKYTIFLNPKTKFLFSTTLNQLILHP